MEEQILEILEELTDVSKRFAENVDRGLNSLGGALTTAYDAEFETLLKKIRKLQAVLVKQS